MERDLNHAPIEIEVSGGQRVNKKVVEPPAYYTTLDEEGRILSKTYKEPKHEDELNRNQLFIYAEGVNVRITLNEPSLEMVMAAKIANMKPLSVTEQKRLRLEREEAYNAWYLDLSPRDKRRVDSGLEPKRYSDRINRPR